MNVEGDGPPLFPELGGQDPEALFHLAQQPGARGARGWVPPTVAALQEALPQYEVLELLGVGGMGAVYKGVQRKLARVVAIKILPPGLEDADLHFAERFKQEAQAMAKFKHPGIVSVYEAGETADGLLYFVMELIEGSDVAKLVAARGKLPPLDAIGIVTRVCEALTYAHERHVVHRDIKPSNILIDSDGTVKIADFGLAKLVTQDSNLTNDSCLLGTPDFLAPEALLAEVKVDQRADVYAVGVMLYQMLTGKVPRGRFDSPSGVVPQIDPRLDAIVDKAMQSDREKRYTTAFELKKDLEKVAQGASEPIAATVSPAGAGQTARVPPEGGSPPKVRRFVAVTLGAAVALGVASYFLLPIGAKTGAGNERASHAATRAKSAAEARHQWRPVPLKHNAQMDRGMVHLVNFDAWAAPRLHLANVAVRATIAWQPSPGRNDLIKVTARAKDKEHYYACLHGAVVEVGYYRAPGMIPVQRWPIERPPAPDEAISLQLACVGHRLAVWVRGSLIGVVDDSTLSDAANVTVQAVDGHVANLEYLDLDGLPEAEALRRLGLDARGAAPPATTRAIPAVATLDAPFVNSLGMKFVPVPITGGPSAGQRVLFSVWETRVQDYARFVTETAREWPQPDFPQGLTHPAVNVSRDDAQAFCAWLTLRERKAGGLTAMERYRLPTDHEWSCAAGIGEREDSTRAPDDKSEELPDVFPWGASWPPPPRVGNYSGEEAVGQETWKNQSILSGYRDPFPHTAPVGSFPANRFGLFDLGGNAWEWCEDLAKPTQTLRVMRGASFNNGGRGGLFSAKRDRHPAGERKDSYGFRVALAADNAD